MSTGWPSFFSWWWLRCWPARSERRLWQSERRFSRFRGRTRHRWMGPGLEGKWRRHAKRYHRRSRKLRAALWLSRLVSWIWLCRTACLRFNKLAALHVLSFGHDTALLDHSQRVASALLFFEVEGHAESSRVPHCSWSRHDLRECMPHPCSALSIWWSYLPSASWACSIFLRAPKFFPVSANPPSLALTALSVQWPQ